MTPKGWDETKLGELFEFKNGFNAEKEAYGKGLRFVNVMEVFNHDVLMAKDIKGRVQTSAKHTTNYLVRYGDVLFNRTSETFDEIAMSAVYLDQEDVVFGGFVIRAQPTTQRLLPQFCVYFFQSASVRKEMIRRGQGAVRANIGQKDLALVPVKTPPIPEQEKIAAILSTWDRAIEATEKLISNSQTQKKALMQQLLTGKIRFNEFPNKAGSYSTRYGTLPHDWGFVKVNTIATEMSERNYLEHDYPVLSCSKYHGFVDSLTYFNKQVFSENRSNYKVIKSGSFGFPSNHIEEGSIGYQNLYEVGVVSPIYCVFKTDEKVYDGYLYKLFKTDHYRQIFAAYTSASVDRRGSLRWKEFSKICVPLPSTKEQKKISAAIDSITLVENAYSKKLNFLKQEKAALMQQLLTGKRRVKVEGAAA